MNFIFLDLEYNTKRHKTKQGRRILLTEIIQMSLLKTNVFLEEIGSYDKYIKTNNYNSLNDRISELTGITKDDISRHGVYFEKAMIYVKEFMKDINYVFVWGSNDYDVLIKNCKHRRVKFDFINEIKFINVQYFYKQHNNLKNDPSLKKTATNNEFYTNHNALHDCYMLREVVKEIGVHNLIYQYELKNKKDKILEVAIENEEESDES